MQRVKKCVCFQPRICVFPCVCHTCRYCYFTGLDLFAGYLHSTAGRFIGGVYSIGRVKQPLHVLQLPEIFSNLVDFSGILIGKNEFQMFFIHICHLAPASPNSFTFRIARAVSSGVSTG